MKVAKRVETLTVLLVAISLSLTACGSSGGSKSNGSSSASDKSPVVVGYINQEIGSSPWPDNTVGTDAAVSYVNDALGGIGGRPIQLKKCFTDGSPQSGVKCAQEMANDDSVQMVVMGVVLSGDDAIFKALAGKKPIVGWAPATPSQYSTEDTYMYTPGGPGQNIAYAELAAATIKPKPKTAAVIYLDYGDAKSEIQAGLAADGMTGTFAALDPNSPNFSATLLASGANHADVIILVTLQPLCAGFAKAIQQLNISAPIVSGGVCDSQSVLSAVGNDENGWLELKQGAPLNLEPPTKDLTTIKDALAKYAAGKTVGTSSPLAFALMWFVGLALKAVGPDKISPASVTTYLKSYSGPVPFLATKTHCGAMAKYPTICGTQMFAYKIEGGKVVNLNMPIDVADK